MGSYIFTVEQPTDYRRGNISTSAYRLGLTLLLHVHGTDSTEELGKKKGLINLALGRQTVLCSDSVLFVTYHT